MKSINVYAFIALMVSSVLMRADQFYLWNKTSGPVDVAYKSSQEMRTVNILAGSQAFVGFSPQQMTVTSNGICSYFSDIGMNGIYSIVDIISWGQGVALRFSGKTRQSVELTHVLIRPDSVMKCSKRLQDRFKTPRAVNKSSLSIQNVTAFPVTLELDLGKETRIVPKLQPKGSAGSVIEIGPNAIVYNIRIYSQDSSCTTLNNISMNSWFNLMQIDFENGRYVVKYSHTGGTDSRIAWEGSMVRPVAFTVTPNASVPQWQEYIPQCWNPNLDI